MFRSRKALSWSVAATKRLARWLVRSAEFPAMLSGALMQDCMESGKDGATADRCACSPVLAPLLFTDDEA
ncbi:hypothetical protein MRX96_033600 [Rhipicephalus microplus]